jgi:hypothetical protein
MTFLSRKPRRPKPGTVFLLIRLLGWSFQIVGWLLIMAALIGFVIVLVKMGSTLLEAFQYTEQKMAGLVIIMVLSWLLVCVLIGFAGIVFVGVGFAFGRWGTEPVIPAPFPSPVSAPVQPAGPG